MSRCREHCPTRGHGGPWLLDLLAGLALLTGVYWAAGKVAPVADAGMTRVAVIVGAVAGLLVLGFAVGAVVVAVLNRRARNVYATLEREARARTAEKRAPRALTEAARALEAAPKVRAEAFVERERAWDVA